MARQFRGCSKLVYAPIIEAEGNTTYGDVKTLAPVKAISRDITSDSEPVWADNVLQQNTFAGTTVTRSFDCTRLDPAVEAELLGLSTVAVGTEKAYATDPDASERPYFAFGYALHDGDADKPCEIVWAYRGIVNSISKAANTIDNATGSEGQTIEITFTAPLNKFTTTNKRNLDISMPVGESTKVDKWFEQVVTPDNIASVMGA